MSQQGGTPTGHEDDWWSQLYDDTTEDTGPTAAGDSVDDRFASAAGTVELRGPGEGTGAAPGTGSGPATDPGPGSGEGSAGSGVPAPRAAGNSGRPAAADPPTEPPGFRPYGPSAPEPPAVPAPPADTPVAPPEGLRPEGLRPAGFRPDGPASPGASPQPPAAAPGPPAPAPPSLRPAGPLRPYDPRPYPQPPAAPPPADNPGSGRGDLRPGNPPGPAPYARPAALPAPEPAPRPLPSAPPQPPPSLTPLDYVGSGPPTYDAEPTALPPADPDELDDLVSDTVLDGARYGASTLRAASVRGDSARFRGEPRRDSLLTARFGAGEQALVLVAMATGARATPGAHRAAAEACHWIARAVGRSHARLSEDIRAARRGDLKSGLHRLTDRSLGKLRASAAEQGIDPEEYSAGLRCLLLPADPECRTRVFFGVGPGGLFRLRDGEWQDIEPSVADAIGEAVVGFGSQPAETSEGDRLTMDLGIPTPPSPYEPAPEPPREPFRFRASVARPGDALLMCTGGLAEPLRGEPELSAHLAGRWSGTTPPGLAAFLADTQVRVKGYADDRTAAAVWEA
ncbi:protein phosphatase 2C domain-containing protein [Streptomyces sp. NPDC091219]|uniref:protein phosphatase 2C domain-containing protein n=1 Tax=Streptomyces sp. NPDC091219 TaxID=3155193 RepID=UPI00344CB46B